VTLPPEFPTALRELVEAELAAGNEIAEISGGFPAAPVGCYVKLTQRVTTRPRTKTPEIDFYERNMPDYSGEFTDAQRHFFVLEPPAPPPPPPDMDAIRASLAGGPPAPVFRTPSAPPPPPNGLVAEFERSMTIDYEKWREGIGYDVSLIAKASREERASIETILMQRRVEDWRDVEALAALDTPRARTLLKQAAKSGDARVATAVNTYAPQLVSRRQRIATLVAALEGADTYGGLTQALLQVEEFHPPPVIAALWRGLRRSGREPVHFAAMLMFLHGKAPVAFDWEQRPFFLRFGSGDDSERASAYRELCEKLGGDPNR
jgi:hypothetical protein